MCGSFGNKPHVFGVIYRKGLKASRKENMWITGTGECRKCAKRKIFFKPQTGVISLLTAGNTPLIKKYFFFKQG
ncbi:MAG: hypothetical protein ABS85_06370 [Sphingobacteriales bacterium SCN 48-20]|jgi:hypothetical protein|nr:MAG: hypothetical protein ABS85_06370 [Sphingobacteriales bacterium SCN 48-20]OJW44846.1 MAG: hypothetical protein BGO56_15440 [Sphingobacteriales bacterium 48-107]